MNLVKVVGTIVPVNWFLLFGAFAQKVGFSVGKADE